MKKTVLWIMAAVLTISACSKGDADGESLDGSMSKAEAYYKNGYENDRKMQHRMAEYYWKNAIAETANSTSAEDLAVYAKTASHLTNLYCVRGEYEAALSIAVPAVERLEKLQCDTTSDYTNLLVYIGCCQSGSGKSADEVTQYFERAYTMHLDNIKKHRTNETYKNAIAGVINIAYYCNEKQRYDDALKWTKRFGELISECEQRFGVTADYVDKQWARYDIYRAIAFEGLGRRDEAAAVFDKFLKTAYSQTPSGQILAIDYLVRARRWEEAAVCYESADALLAEHGTGMTLENIQNIYVKKYLVNRQANRMDSAIATSMYVCDCLDNAVNDMRRLEAKELSAIQEKEAEKAELRVHDTRLRRVVGAVLSLVVLVLLGFWTLKRHRSRVRLQKAYDLLQADHSDIEESSRREEREQTEQQIARSIQTLAAVSNLPLSDYYDIHATIERGQAVCGDFYDVILRNNQLLFCIGTAAGQGVSASVSMLMAKTLFNDPLGRRTLATNGTQECSLFNDQAPLSIVQSINRTMATVDGEAVSATMFVGLLDLTTGRLTYCNAGHPAPLIVAQRLEDLPVDENMPVGIDATWNFTSQEAMLEPGNLFFAYTNGLIDAANAEGEPFELRRMKGEALQSCYGLSYKPQPFIERINSTLRRHIGDVPPTADITMFAIRFMKKCEDVEPGSEVLEEVKES